jgi:extracellular elastinolytic metalloproteinase
VSTDLYTPALAHALHDQRGLSPDEAARVAYQPHGAALTAGPGETVVQLQQTFAGVPIVQAVRSVRFREGAPPAVTGRPVPVAQDGVPLATISAAAAAYVACLHVAHDAGVEVSNRRPRVLATFAHPDRPTVLRKVGFHDPIMARLRLLDPHGTRAGSADEGPPVDPGRAGRASADGPGASDAGAPPRADLTLVWQVQLELVDDHRPWSVLVTATGRDATVLEATTLAAHVVVRGPVHDLSPPTDQPPTRTFPPQREAFPHFDGAPLPPGPWLTADRTEGNNVVVMDDRGDAYAALADAAGDLTFTPAAPLDLDQARVNAFYLCNFCHDFFWLLGFDEAMGNFQQTNTTPHGAGRDPVQVFVFSRAREPFAFFLNRLDGRKPELVLRPGPGGRHPALDADVVIHEYAHGVTDRIVGRGQTERPFREPQSVALAEALSDYFALTLQNHLRRRAGHAPTHVFGKWVSGNSTGLRVASYGPGLTATYGSLRDPGYDRAHDAGQVFCQTLLELADVLGEGDPVLGDERGWQVVFDAVCRLHPGSDGPHFLHARDAIYAALATRIGSWGVDQTAVTQNVRAVFAARGMGDDARSPTAAYNTIVEAF